MKKRKSRTARTSHHLPVFSEAQHHLLLHVKNLPSELLCQSPEAENRRLRHPKNVIYHPFSQHKAFLFLPRKTSRKSRQATDNMQVTRVASEL
jgi:hypothetical protein